MNVQAKSATGVEAFAHMFPLGEDTTAYTRISTEHVGVAKFNGHDILTVDPAALTLMTRQAFAQISHLLRPAHLKQLASILDDPEASDNDRFVALDLLKNANIAAGMVLPMCQDTGTATIIGKKGQQVWTGGGDAEAISQGVADAYTQLNLRYSQVSPTTMFEEANTGNNLPAQIDLYAEEGDEYHFMFIAKGGGSANKFFLHQQTKALLNPESLAKFLEAQIKTLGTAACPPYHLAVAIGGMSAEMALKTAKLASTHYLDGLPTTGGKTGQAFRDLEWEAKLLDMTRKSHVFRSPAR
jgi:fumarate hydratase class I